MPTVEAFLTECAREVGYTEHPAGSNRTKFAAEAGHANGHPWCLTSLVALANRTRLHLPYTGAYTPSAAAAFKKANAWGTEPRRGAWVFFDWPGDNKNRIQHVGVVAEWDAHTLVDYEGNTSPDAHGSQDNGGGFWLRHRPRNSSIVGYGYPPYDPGDDMTPEEHNMLVDNWNRLKNLESVATRDIDTLGPQIAEVLAAVKANPQHGTGAGDVDPDEAAKAVLDLLAERLRD